MIKRFCTFRDREDGVALVEFALFLPLFALALYVIIEFSRAFFTYQQAVVGVRDATRYAARTMEPNLCVGQTNNSSTVVSVGTAGSPDTSYSIIERNMQNEVNELAANVEIETVSTSYRCVVPDTAGTYRQAEIPIARVVARIVITLPLGGILELNGGPVIPDITSIIADEGRVFGV